MNSRYISAVLLFGCSGLYTTKLGVSPVYFAVLMGSGLLLIDLLKGDKNIKVDFFGGIAFPSILILFLIITQLLSMSDSHNLLNLIMAIAMFPIVLLASRRLRYSQLNKCINIFLVLNLLLMTAECIYRISHPKYDFLVEAIQEGRDVEDSSIFYAYKFNSFMYIDSNFVGLQLVILFAFLISLRNVKMPMPNIYYIWISILIVGTLSRASIITMIVIYISSKLHNLKKLTLVLLLPTLLLGLVLVVYIISDDLSFLSKFDIFFRLINYYKGSGMINMLLGVGVGRSVDYIGIGGHILPVVYSLELGLIATFLIAVYWVRLIIKVPALSPMFIALLVNGLALTTFAIPYFYACIAIISLLYMKINFDSK